MAKHDLSAIREAIDAGIVDVNEQSYYKKQMALMEAVYSYDLQMVTYFLEKGVDIDKQDRNGNPAIFFIYPFPP